MNPTSYEFIMFDQVVNHFSMQSDKWLKTYIWNLLSDLFKDDKTHFSKPAQWKYIEIIKPEVVEESVLLRAKHLGKNLFKDVDLASQNSLCQNLRRHLRMWKAIWKSSGRLAEQGPIQEQIRFMYGIC